MVPLPEKLLSIKEAADKLGVSTKTLRRWEKRGRVTPQRTIGGQRRYGWGDLEGLRLGSRHETHNAPPPPPVRVWERVNAVSPRKLFAATILAGILVGFFIPVIIVATRLVGKYQDAGSLAIVPQSDESYDGTVLASATATPDFTFTVNVPARFAEEVEFQGEITAPNLVYSITAGDGISASDSQNPKITNTGVLSLGGKTGTLKLEASSGISIDGLKITNSDLGTSVNVFKTISVSGQSDVVADGNTDTLTFANGTGVTITTDAGNDKLTFAADATLSGWTDDGTTVRLTTSTDSIGIGTTSPSTKLHVVGSTTLAGAVTLGSATSDALTFTGRIASGNSLVPAVDLSSDLGTASLRFNNIYAANLTLDSGFSSSGQALVTYNPTDTTFAQSSLRINVTTPSDNEQMIGIGSAGEERASIDAEGDLTLGYDGAAGSSVPATSYPLTIYGHNSTNVAFIDTSGNAYFAGNVGIGTTSPGGILGVIGGNGVANDISLVSTTGGIQLSTGSGSRDINILSGDAINLKGVLGAISLSSGSPTHGSGLTIDTSGDVTIGTNTFFADVSSGNVGIGTTGPSQKLTVAGNLGFPSDQQGIVWAGSASSLYSFSNTVRMDIGNILMLEFGPGGLIGNINQRSDQDLVWQGDTVANLLTVDASADGVGIGYANPGTAKLAINGNVGIGTTSPGGILDVIGGNGVANDISLVSTTGGIQLSTGSGSRDINILSGDAINLKGVLGAISLSSGSPTHGSGLSINTSGDVTIGTNTLFADVSSGNVGIGTTSPGALLDVAGTGRFTTTSTLSTSPALDLVAPSGGYALRLGTTSPSNIYAGDFNQSGGVYVGTQLQLSWRSGSGYVESPIGFAVNGAVYSMVNSGYITSLGQNVVITPASGYNSVFTSGNVGIGDTTPDDLLDVESSSLGYNFLFGSGGVTLSTSGTSGLNIDTFGQLSLTSNQGAASALELVSTAGGIDISAGSSTGDIDILGGDAINLKGVLGAINLSAGSPTVASGLTVATTGNVGIGTTGPAETLHVNGGIRFGAAGIRLYQVHNTVNNRQIQFENDVSGDTNTKLRLVMASGIVAIDTGAAATGNITMFSNADGNVAIGTTSDASYRLKVSGTTYLGGALTLAGNVNLNGNWLSGDGQNEGVYVDSTGNVGIGDTTPDDLLDVESSSLGYNFLFGSNGITLSTSGTSGINVDTFGQLSLTSNQGAANALELVSTAGGIDISTGSSTGDIDILGGDALNLKAVLGSISLSSGSPTHGSGLKIDTSGDVTIGTNTLFADVSSGNVGIGTTAPTDKLDVGGAIRLTSDIAWDATKPGRIYKSATNGLTMVGVTGSILDFGFYSAAGQQLMTNPTGTNNMNLAPSNNGNVGIGTTGPVGLLDVNTKLVVLSGGNVGIGDTTPDDLLDVESSSLGYNFLFGSGGVTLSTSGTSGLNIDTFGQLSLTSNQGAANALELISTAGGIDISTGSGTADIDILGGDAINLKGVLGAISLSSGSPTHGSGLKVDTSGDVTIGTNTLFADVSSGNVGIGTTGPGAKLDLRDGAFYISDADVAHGVTSDVPAAVAGSLEVYNATAGGMRLRGWSDVGGVPGLVLQGTIGATDPTDTTAAVGIEGAKLSGTGRAQLGALETVLSIDNYDLTGLMTILGSGNVGIGTTAPTQKLNVEGSILASTTTGTFIGWGTGNGLKWDASFGPFINSTASTVFNIDSDNDDADIRYFAVAKNSNTATGGTELFRITESGNVGIGDTTPDDLLDVESSSLGYNFLFGSNGITLSTSGTSGLNIDTFGQLSLTSNQGAANALELVSTAGGIDISTGSGTQDIDILSGDQINLKAGTNGITLSSGTITHGSGLKVDSSGDVTIGTNTLFADVSSGNVGIGTTTPSQKLHVYRSTDGPPVRFEDSNGYCEIDPTTTTWTCTSDLRLKKDIAPLDSNLVLAGLDQLRGVNFRWISQDSTSRLRTGFIAQEVETVFPNLVRTDEQGLKSVSYGGFTPYLVEAIKQLGLKIDQLGTAPSKNLEETLAKIDQLPQTHESSDESHETDKPADVNLTVIGQLTAQGALVVEGPTTFKEETVFKKLVRLLAEVIFAGRVQFLHAPVFANNAAGFAVVPQGTSTLGVPFTEAFDTSPVVTISLTVPSATDSAFLTDSTKTAVTEVTQSGFTIVLDAPAVRDTTYAWMAVTVANLQTTVGERSIPALPTPTPTPEPETPTATDSGDISIKNLDKVGQISP